MLDNPGPRVDNTGMSPRRGESVAQSLCTASGDFLELIPITNLIEQLISLGHFLMLLYTSMCG